MKAYKVSYTDNEGRATTIIDVPNNETLTEAKAIAALKEHSAKNNIYLTGIKIKEILRLTNPIAGAIANIQRFGIFN